jgi:hypothetical protein
MSVSILSLEPEQWKEVMGDTAEVEDAELYTK